MFVCMCAMLPAHFQKGLTLADRRASGGHQHPLLSTCELDQQLQHPLLPVCELRVRV